MSNDKNVVQPGSMNFRAWDEHGQEIPSDQFPRIYDPDDLNGFYSPRSDLYTPPKQTPSESPPSTGGEDQDEERPRLCLCDAFEPIPDRPMPWGIKLGAALLLFFAVVGWVLFALEAWYGPR